MQLRDVKSELEQTQKLILGAKATQYDLLRSKKSGNLFLQYSDGHHHRLPVIPFRPYQEDLQIKLFIEGIKRHFRILPRRSGKEVESWNMILQGAISQPGLYLMIYPTNVRAKMVLWEGSILLPDQTSLKFLDMIPAELIDHINNQELSIHLVNGSVIRVLGSDIDPHKLRGTNALGVVISEFAYCDPRVMHILLPILRQNGGWLILQSTFNGRNHAYFLYKQIKDNPSWACRIDSVESLVDKDGNRYITDAMIDEDRMSGMPEYLIQQEYYSVVQLNEESIYFAHQMKYLDDNNRIVPDLWLPNTRVYTATDKGRNDNNVMLMFQVDRMNCPHIIDYIEANNRTPDYYFDEAKRRMTKMGLHIFTHFYPHDGAERDYNTGKNVVDFGQEYGATVKIVPKPTSKINAIQQMRKMIYKCKFRAETTGRLIDAMSNYSKVFDEKMGVFKEEPLHNWCSHPVDAFQTLTLAVDGGMLADVPHEVIYYNK